MIKAWFDGSITKNPGGTARGGCVIKRDNRIIHTASEEIGSGDGMSVNVSEIGGAVLILKYLLDNNITEDVIIYGDSQTAIHVLKHTQVKWERESFLYFPFYLQALGIKRRLTCKLTFVWIPREENEEADALTR